MMMIYYARGPGLRFAAFSFAAMCTEVSMLQISLLLLARRLQRNLALEESLVQLLVLSSNLLLA